MAARKGTRACGALREPVRSCGTPPGHPSPRPRGPGPVPTRQRPGLSTDAVGLLTGTKGATSLNSRATGYRVWGIREMLRGPRGWPGLPSASVTFLQGFFHRRIDLGTSRYRMPTASPSVRATLPSSSVCTGHGINVHTTS